MDTNSTPRQKPKDKSVNRPRTMSTGKVLKKINSSNSVYTKQRFTDYLNSYDTFMVKFGPLEEKKKEVKRPAQLASVFRFKTISLNQRPD